MLTEEGYDHACDLWSMGVIAYMLLSASPPFAGRNDRETRMRILAVGTGPGGTAAEDPARGGGFEFEGGGGGGGGGGAAPPAPVEVGI